MHTPSSSKTISLLLVLMVGFIDWVGIGLVYPMFSSMLFHPDAHFLPEGTPDTVRGLYLGILLAAGPLTQFFSAPICGTLSDRKGRRSVLNITLLIGVIGYVLSMLSVAYHHLIGLLISRIIVGISTGSAAVVSAAVADLSRPEEKAKNFALFSMATGTGFAVGPFLGGWLSGMDWGFISSFDIPFFCAGAFTLINLLMVIYLFRETHFVRNESKITLMIGLKNLRKAMRLHRLNIVFLVVFLFCFGWSFYYEFIPVQWITQYGFGPSEIGTFFAYSAGFYALSCGVFIRPLANRIRPEVLLFAGLLCSGVYIWLLLFNISHSWLWAYLPLQQFFISLLFPTSATLVSNWSDEKIQGEVMGILQSVDSFAFAISPLISGWVLGLSTKMPVLIGGFAFVLGGVILGFALRRDLFKKKATL